MLKDVGSEGRAVRELKFVPYHNKQSMNFCRACISTADPSPMVGKKEALLNVALDNERKEKTQPQF
jgi:hypothetical protein